MATALVLLLPVAACASAPLPGGGTAAVQPLAKADGWRPGLVEGLDGDQPFGLVEIAYDRATAEQAWSDNVPGDLPERAGEPDQDGRYGDLAGVNFDTHAVVVWSSGQSGSCPGWLADIRTSAEMVEVETGQTGQVCTDDYNPYRMVLAVARDRLPEPGDLPISDVTINDRALGRQSLVDAYPAGD